MLSLEQIKTDYFEHVLKNANPVKKHRRQNGECISFYSREKQRLDTLFLKLVCFSFNVSVVVDDGAAPVVTFPFEI